MLNAKHSGKPVECAALLNEILLAFRRVQSSGKWRCYCVHCASLESKVWMIKKTTIYASMRKQVLGTRKASSRTGLARTDSVAVACAHTVWQKKENAHSKHTVIGLSWCPFRQSAIGRFTSAGRVCVDSTI